MKFNKLKILKEVKLNDSEKEVLLKRIGIKAGVSFSEPSPYMPRGIFIFFANPRFIKVAVYVLILVFGGSAGAYASWNAVPGDLLYGVKTKVLEKTADFAAFTPIDKAKRNYTKIETRIKELEILAERGEATKDRTKNIEKELEKNFADFDENIKKTERGGGGKDKLEADLEENLRGHKKRIKELRDRNKFEDEHALEEVFERVRNHN